MKPSLHRCQNCHCTLPEDTNYCDHCGQRRIQGIPSIRELLSDFTANIWALDSKLLRTMSNLLFRPGQLTLAYLQGIRRRYYTPFKLFLFWLTFSFILVNVLLSKVAPSTINQGFGIESIANQVQVRQALQNHFQDSSHQKAIDSILLVYSSNGNLPKDTIMILNGYRFSIHDLKKYSAKELAKEQKIERFTERLFITQLIKTVQHPNNLKTHLLSRLSWILLFFIPLMVFWLRLLYSRKRYYYILHFAYLLHLQTFILVLITVFALLPLSGILPISRWAVCKNILVMISFIYTFWSLRVVYQQSWLKTGLKFVLFWIGYMFTITIAMLLVFGINFLLF